MSDARKQSSIEDIRKPPVDRPKEPDKHSSVEAARAAEEFQALTTLGRQEYRHREVVVQLQQERDLLQRENARLNEIKDRLLPRNAELEQAHRNAKSNGAQATLAMALGGAFLSVAAHFNTPGMLIAYGVGGASFVWGAILLLGTNRFSWPPDRDARD